MKKVIFAVFATMLATHSFAEVAKANANVETNVGTQSEAGAAVSGNAMGNLNYAPVSNTEVDNPRAAPNTAIGPQLITSNDTCMGSSSAGVSTYGISISAGTTWTDSNCVMLKNSREMWNMGLRAAAVARMCMDDDNRDAMEVSGVKCPDFAEQRASHKRK